MKLKVSREEHSVAHAVKWPGDITDQTSPAVPPNHASHAAVIAPATVRLPIHFFVFSVLWLLYGSVLLPWVAPEAIRFYYQPSVLSLVHVFTLGFITPAIIVKTLLRGQPAQPPC